VTNLNRPGGNATGVALYTSGARTVTLTDIGSGAIVGAKRCLMRAAHRYNQCQDLPFASSNVRMRVAICSCVTGF
jgi:hypothetical protein